MSVRILRTVVMVGLVLGQAAVASAADKLRLGWQVPWATQGQLVMGLKYSNITELTDLDIEYHGFSYGGPLNKAALAGQVDVLLTADQPALVLLSRNPDFRIVGRMMYNRVCIYVPVKSSISDLSGLGGRTVMGPIGAAAERVAMAALERAGVSADDIRVGQLDMAQQSALLAREPDVAEWSGTDALFGFDPLPAIFKAEGKARMLECGKVVSVVVATTEMIESRRDELVRFLKAFRMSWNLFADSPQAVNELFSRDSRLDVDNAVLDEAASIEPNRWASDHAGQRFDFIADDHQVFAETNRFLLDKGIIKQAVEVERFIDLAPLQDPGSLPSADELAAVWIGDTTQK